MEQGFSFHWDPGRNPVMTNPEGLVVELTVEKNIPYLKAGTEFSRPRESRESRVVPIAVLVEEEPCLGAETDEEDRIADAADDLANARRHVSTNRGQDPDAPSSDEGANSDRDSSSDDEAQPDVPPLAQIIPALEGAVPDVPVLRQSLAVRLKAIANSIEHKLSHLPKNPYCESCVRGKMKEKYSHRRTFARELEFWGEVVTCDHVYSASASAMGLDGETESFIIKDLWSGLLSANGVPSEN
jgi:hypothetical protein